MSNPATWLVWLSILILGIAPPLVQAQDPADTPDTAQAAFLRGDHLYAAGQYTAAIEAFRESYALSGEPALLFNLANA